MPSFDSIWRMTVGEKKLLFGKHRVPVGGQAPEGTEPEGGNIEQKQLKPVQTIFFLCSRLSFSPSLFCWFPGRRPDASEEPAFYHAGPWSLDEELVHDFSVGGINDLTAGLGSTKGHFIF